MNHNITDLGIPAESELRGIGINAKYYFNGIIIEEQIFYKFGRTILK
jgi:hypothetical protein